MPPLVSRTCVLQLLCNLLVRRPYSWDVVVRALNHEFWGDEEDQPLGLFTQSTFRIFFQELETCVFERVRIWNGSSLISNEVFNSLAHGTYRWQRILDAPLQRVSDAEVCAYIVCARLVIHQTKHEEYVSVFHRDSDQQHSSCISRRRILSL